MSFGGLILTNSGRNELIKAELGERFNITHVVLGDGSYSGAYTAVNSLVNQVMEIPITRISRTDEEVLLECDFNTPDIPKAFYLREIGIIANGSLCYYDNAREDAEYLNPSSDVLVKQKRMRFVLLISSEVEVNVKIDSSLYALAIDLDKVVHPEYPEVLELKELADSDDIWGILGKMKKAVSELIAHITNKENPHDVDVGQMQLDQVDNTSDMDKPVSTAQQKALDELYQQLTAFTLQKIADLIGGASTSMDTLKEVQDAIAANKSIMDALDAAIGKKASAAEFDSHAKDTTAHITASERTAWNGKLETTGDASNTTTTFSQATTRANLTTKEKLSVSMGKIMKWLADLANGAASSLLGNNLTASRALVSTASGKVGTSAVTSTELGYLDGVTSNVQEQLNELNTGLDRKAPSDHTHDDRYYTAGELDTLFCKNDTLLKTVGGNVAECLNFLGYGFALYGCTLAYSVGKNTYIIRVQGSVIYASGNASSDDFAWGLNLTAILSYSKLSDGLQYRSGIYSVYDSAGTLIRDGMGYAAGFIQIQHGGYRVLNPGRFYNTNGGYGGWPSSHAIAQPGAFYDATIVVYDPNSVG